MNRDRMLLVMCLFSLLALLVFGTFLFQAIEGWHPIDAFYFTGMTMTTIGYGDVTPHTFLGKIITVFFAFISVGIAMYSLSVIARTALRQRVEDIHWLMHKKK